VRRGTSDRWHFHDYWKGNPTITLFDGNITLDPTLAGDGLPAVGVLLELPNGVIVPPETGFLTINASWSTDTLGGVNFTYKPADSNDFFPVTDLQDGVGFQLNTTESNCDVPHRQQSLWKFNLTARPSVPPSGVPPREFHLVINATIGRPLFIDPPHLNWWRDGNVIPLVATGAGELRAAQTPASNVTLPGGLPAPSTGAPDASFVHTLNQTYRIPVDAGRIVPEGAHSIVVLLNWTSDVPQAKLGLRYMEQNLPTPEGEMEIVTDSPGARVYALDVAQAQTDTTYSNRTTWEFRIVPEGQPGAAFEGTFTLLAWASQLEPAEAVAAIAKSG
jgi:hypothetical protein